jgi:hypothetical protein
MTPLIAASFRTSISFAKDGEVGLFRALAVALVTHSASTFVDETHGGMVCNVSFTSVTGKPETCEIADLLVISVLPSGRLRATFWQAKKQGKSKWLGSSVGGEQLDFDGQFNQWDLLSRRPHLVGVGKFHPPSNLLSSFGSAAIGSFGVFYQRGSLVEVSHSTAEFVACHNPLVRHPKMCISGYLAKYSCAENEVLVRPTLESFLDALLTGTIGALLHPAVPAHRWLVDYARRKGASTLSLVQRRAIDAFLSNGPRDDNAAPVPGDGLSVLFVSVPSGA